MKIKRHSSASEVATAMRSLPNPEVSASEFNFIAHVALPVVQKEKLSTDFNETKVLEFVIGVIHKDGFRIYYWQPVCTILP